ncbi:hypothetical protein ACFTXM_11670 [Streptomyces sp. NPDC056930]|uniref:hypothetical protein n=1 Tax=Streptomyces sp. NPDC056930 TaxID=3345967 RepID=UPI003635FEE5
MTDGPRRRTGALSPTGRCAAPVRPARSGFRNRPQKVKDLTDAVSISVGCYHVLALTADGAVKSWGYNGFGQLGKSSFAY